MSVMAPTTSPWMDRRQRCSAPGHRRPPTFGPARRGRTGSSPRCPAHPMVLNDGPLGYTLNGKGFPATEPLAVKRGDTVRIRYMNEGLQIHPMHLHGLTQRVIAVD